LILNRLESNSYLNMSALKAMEKVGLKQRDQQAKPVLLGLALHDRSSCSE